ncbi:MAG: TrmH family RNA methyltransferase [Campylobacterales bacterium]
MLVYGKQVVEYICQKHPEIVETIYLSKEIDKKLFGTFAKVAKIERVDNKKAQAMSRGGNHQGCLALITPLEFGSLDLVENSSRVVILVGVSDVGNIGAIIRTSYAYGVDVLVVAGLKSMNLEAVIRTSSGAALDMPIVLAPESGDLLNRLKHREFDLICAKAGAQSLSKLPTKWALLLGSEDKGIPKRFEKFCTKSLGIEMKNSFDSLNVSVAAGILIDRIVYGRDSK